MIISIRDTFISEEFLFLIGFIIVLVIAIRLILKHKIKKIDEERNIIKVIEDIKPILGKKKIFKRYIGYCGMLNASYNPKFITINYKWVKMLATGKLKLAFRHTIGHEVSHAVQPPNKKIYKKSKNARMLYMWCQEVYCDIEGLNIAMQSDPLHSREEYLKDIKKKIAINVKKGDKNHFSHPSWENRLYWMEHFEVFNEEVIYAIAEKLEITKENDIIQSLIEGWKNKTEALNYAKKARICDLIKKMILVLFIIFWLIFVFWMIDDIFTSIDTSVRDKIVAELPLHKSHYWV